LALGYSEELIEIETEPAVPAEQPAVKEVIVEPETEAKPEPEELESAVLGQARTIWWTLAVIAAVTLAGGGLLLLRKVGN
jgi:hypothetical protein